MTGRPFVPLSADLPPLVMGTATFNSQYNHDPYALPTTELVHQALSRGIRAFDTSPYYGPAEELLGRALATEYVERHFPRHTYRLLTKVGRVASSSFDYSARWVRQSVRRSLLRLHTPYLDVAYCHDVEFVTPAEVLEAVRELRRLRDNEGGIVRYIGISGYPVDVLCELAEMVLRETGEPLDAVMSYANYTVQNTRLTTSGLARLVAAGVDVVLNASPLGMGLLRRQGVPIGDMGDFHPAPNGLRNAIRSASDWVDSQGEKLEVVAIRWALESWLRDGAKAGALGPPLARALDADPGFLSVAHTGTGERLGVSVMGVSNLDELNEALLVWHSIIDGLENRDDEDAAGQDKDIPTPSDGQITDRAWSRGRRARIAFLAEGVRSVLGSEWVDYVWPSPGPGFVNTLPAEHIAALQTETDADADAKAAESPEKSSEPVNVAVTVTDERMLTPPL